MAGPILLKKTGFKQVQFSGVIIYLQANQQMYYLFILMSNDSLGRDFEHPGDIKSDSLSAKIQDPGCIAIMSLSLKQQI